jgi:hypothetical protein
MMKIKVIRDKHRNNKLTPSFYSPTIDFLTLHKNNWRTKFKLGTMCILCHSTEHLEMHHLKPVSKGLGPRTYKGFDLLIASLGRQQALLCRTCHVKVGNGEYSGAKLRDIIDLRIVAPESLLKQGIPPTSSRLLSETKDKKDPIVINEKEQTYYNPDLHNYYNRKAEPDTVE